jgi:oligopeptide/dipeptide ABC transporter ATP-binding protein
VDTISVENIVSGFEVEKRRLYAVRDISFAIRERETFALVGESGCGKTLTALTILRLLPQPGGFIESGKIHFAGRDLLALTDEEMRGVRGKEISMIFQEPMTSLNPVFTIGYQIAEVYTAHGVCGWKEGMERAGTMLDRVKIPDAAHRIRDYPHQLSGGMRQRVMIAMALALNPSLLIADEPTTALDVTVQAQILQLIEEIKEAYGMTVLLITHDLGIVAEVADRVAIMYLGKIVEFGGVSELFEDPLHPYTKGLLMSLPSIGDGKKRLSPIPGIVPDLTSVPPGCPFYERCPERIDGICNVEFPEAIDYGNAHVCACYWVERARSR